MRRALTLVACSILLLTAAAGTAFASEAPLVNGEIEVQLWPGVQTGQVLVIVGVTLPEDASLPATVRLPIIPGSEVTWAGEIGGDAANDVPLEPRIAKGKGSDYAEFELRTHRRGQIELGGIMYDQTGTKVEAEVEFVQSVPSEVTSFAVRVPATASDLKIEPAPAGEPDRNEAGEYLYTLPSKQLKEGQKATVGFSYDTALPRAKAPISTSNLLIAILAVLVVLAVAALALAVVWQRRRGRTPSAPDGEA